LTKSRKTNAGLWSSSGSTHDLPTIAFFRAGALLRRNGPVQAFSQPTGPGAIMDKSGHRFVGLSFVVDGIPSPETHKLKGSCKQT